MPELCSPVPFSFFWGVNEPRVLQQALILSACIWDVGRFFVRAAIFHAATHPTAAYSISEVMAYHQREREILLNLKHPLSPGFAAESESMDATMLVREQAGEARRRRIQWALLLADVIWLALWFTVFGMRRPWGFLIAGPVSGLSYVGLSACPLPEDPAKRRLNAVMIAHYLCAVGVFTGFILVLVGGFGWCSPWPLAPFLLCTVAAGLGSALGHSEVVKGTTRLARRLSLVSVLGEWAALTVFYAALAMPPDY